MAYPDPRPCLRRVVIRLEVEHHPKRCRFLPSHGQRATHSNEVGLAGHTSEAASTGLPARAFVVAARQQDAPQPSYTQSGVSKSAWLQVETTTPLSWNGVWLNQTSPTKAIAVAWSPQEVINGGPSVSLFRLVKGNRPKSRGEHFHSGRCWAPPTEFSGQSNAIQPHSSVQHAG